jgi:hypothetical protein
MLGVQRRQVLVKQVTRANGQTLGSTDVQSFYMVQLWMPMFKPIPP